MLSDVLQGNQQSVFWAVPPLRDLPPRFGEHCFTGGGNPDGDRTPSSAKIARVMAAARRRLRDADRYRILEVTTCCYKLTADERFVVDVENKCLTAAGFSGHGYTFGPLIGDRLALVVDEWFELADCRDRLAGVVVR
jgi:glycine/D-amino acid oxidase-like deaminating enzyme